MADNENMPKYTPRWRIRLWKLAFIAAALLAHAEWWPWWPWRILGLALLPIAFFELAFAAVNAEPKSERPQAHRKRRRRPLTATATFCHRFPTDQPPSQRCAGCENDAGREDLVSAFATDAETRLALTPGPSPAGTGEGSTD